MRARDRHGAWVAAIVLAIAAPVQAAQLIDTGDPGDAPFMICNGDGSMRGFATYVATYQDVTVGRVIGRIEGADADHDGRPDPTWDANADGVLSPGEPAAGKVIVIDLGPTPPDLTVLDGQDLRQFPETIVYLSPSLIPLALPPAQIDSGPLSIPLAADHVYAFGFSYSHPGCAVWSVGGFDPPIVPPPTLPPPVPGATMTTIGRFGLLGILGGDAGSDFSLITSAQTNAGSLGFVLDDTEDDVSGSGDGSGAGGGEPRPTFGAGWSGDRDHDGVIDGHDDCPDVYDPDQTCADPTGGCDAGGAGDLALPAAVLVFVALRRRALRARAR